MKFNRRLPRNVILISALALLNLMFNGFAFAETAVAPTANTIPLSFFGMHFHHADSGTSWPKASIGSWRLWDAYTAWPNLEPEPGKWDFKRLDAYVIKAKLTGTSLLLPLGLSPAWASARPDEKSGYGPGQAAEPRDMDDWKRYVRTVATRYKGKIRDYEIWNEVNVPGFYSGSVEAMVTLTRETYRILKEIDPENRLVSPSVVGSSQNISPWLEEFLQKGGGQYVDVIGYHFYAPKGRPELMLPLIAQVRSIMQKHGVGDKPLWNTETGWLIHNDEQEFAPGSYDKTWVILDQDKAAAYLARAFIVSWAAGVQRFYWYAWDNGVMGLIEPKSKRDKTAVRGYEAVVRWLEGARHFQCLKQSVTWECSLIGRDGANEHIVWSESDSDIVYKLPSDWKVEKIESLDGSQRVIHQGDSEQITISGQPLRLISMPSNP